MVEYVARCNTLCWAGRIAISEGRAIIARKAKINHIEQFVADGFMHALSRLSQRAVIKLIREGANTAARC